MFKISIRTNILTLFTVLVTVISGIIIFIYYQVGNRILLDSAYDLLRVSSANVAYNVVDFVKPARNRVDFAANAISNKSIVPDDSNKFASFLFSNISDLSTLSASYFAAPNGNSYIVQRVDNNTFVNETIINSSKVHHSVTKYLDKYGKVTSVSLSYGETVDPRTRPWYIQAFKKQSNIASDIYLFLPFGKKKHVLGMTIANPVYDKEKKFLGVFAIDLELSAISRSIEELFLTKNSAIFMVDSFNNLIATNKPIKKISDYNSLQKISDSLSPWVYAGVLEYFKSNKQLIFYTYNDTKYLAFFTPFKLFGAGKAFLAIALPVNDIIGKLNEQLFISIRVAILVLLLGLLFVSAAANAISRPIVRLEEEAKLIKKLNFDDIDGWNSHITEVINMRDAFTSMKRSLKSFISYVPLAVVKDLVITGNLAKVGGENKVATFLFTDITGFTSLSEGMDPQKLMSYLSAYLACMTKVILQYKGTVDKYMGDAIMAFWGAPLGDRSHALHACKSALSMMDKLEQLNNKLVSDGKPRIDMRIGINTGNAVIGNVGSEDRFNYTAIGDCVNVTNRIEELNKLYGTSIIVNQSTHHIVEKHFKFRLLDFVAVRGKHDGTLVFELLQDKNKFGDKLSKYNEDFKVAFDSYMAGRFEEALSLFEALENDYTFDTLASRYVERCQGFINSPPQGWKGIWRL